MKINGKLTNLTVTDKGSKLSFEVTGGTEKGTVESLAKWTAFGQDLILDLREDQTQTKLDPD